MAAAMTIGSGSQDASIGDLDISDQHLDDGYLKKTDGIDYLNLALESGNASDIEEWVNAIKTSVRNKKMQEPTWSSYVNSLKIGIRKNKYGIVDTLLGLGLLKYEIETRDADAASSGSTVLTISKDAVECIFELRKSISDGNIEACNATITKIQSISGKRDLPLALWDCRVTQRDDSPSWITAISAICMSDDNMENKAFSMIALGWEKFTKTQNSPKSSLTELAVSKCILADDSTRDCHLDIMISLLASGIVQMKNIRPVVQVIKSGELKKLAILETIQKRPDRVELLTQALHAKESLFGQLFWAQRGSTNPSPEHGTLKKIDALLFTQVKLAENMFGEVKLGESMFGGSLPDSYITNDEL